MGSTTVAATPISAEADKLYDDAWLDEQGNIAHGNIHSDNLINVEIVRFISVVDVAA